MNWKEPLIQDLCEDRNSQIDGLVNLIPIQKENLKELYKRYGSYLDQKFPIDWNRKGALKYEDFLPLFNDVKNKKEKNDWAKWENQLEQYKKTSNSEILYNKGDVYILKINNAQQAEILSRSVKNKKYATEDNPEGKSYTWCIGETTEHWNAYEAEYSQVYFLKNPNNKASGKFIIGLKHDNETYEITDGGNGLGKELDEYGMAKWLKSQGIDYVF